MTLASFLGFTFQIMPIRFRAAFLKSTNRRQSSKSRYEYKWCAL